MKLVKILMTSIVVWAFSISSLKTNNVSKNYFQNIFRSFNGKYYSLNHKGIKILYSKNGNLDFISVGYDLNSDGKVDLVASFKVKKIESKSITADSKAEAVIIDKDNDGIFDYKLRDINGDGFFDIKKEFTKHERKEYNLKNLNMTKTNYMNFKKLMRR